MAQTQTAMTPEQAAGILQETADYKERLTNRASGLTSMVWGLVVPLIFLTYTAANPAIVEAGMAWLNSILWAPWVAAGVGLTSAIWNTQAISMHQRPDPKGTRRIVLYVAAFFALAGATLAVALATATTWHPTATMTVASGLLAALIAVLERRGGLVATQILLVGGALLVAVGYWLNSVPADLAGLIAAATSTIVWFGHGITAYQRG